jgi:uncharacterized protein (DUF2235 family)
MIQIQKRRVLRRKDDDQQRGGSFKAWSGPAGGGGGSGSRRAVRPYRHIMLGIDGTWQAAFSDVFHSNVFRLCVALNYADKTKKKNSQVFIYSPGLGTMTESGRLIAGAFGDGFDQSILHAYINLVSNYRQDDKIYIFGFSRGAVTARALTGFITYAGLLKADFSSHIEHAWNYFTGRPQNFNYAGQRGSITHRNVKVEFLGLWDTVSGPHKQSELLERYRFTGNTLDPSVKHGVHVISIDESRGDFDPIVWKEFNDAGAQTLDQIWLPGVHCDIGGGYSDAFLSTVSLVAMIDKLAEYFPDLSFDQEYIEQTLLPLMANETVVVNDEWKGYVPQVLRGGPSRRSCASAIRASVHPIMKLMLSKPVTLRGTKNVLYNPPSWDGDSLPETTFASGSWYANKLKDVLASKLH